MEIKKKYLYLVFALAAFLITPQSADAIGLSSISKSFKKGLKKAKVSSKKNIKKLDLDEVAKKGKKPTIKDKAKEVSKDLAKRTASYLVPASCPTCNGKKRIVANKKYIQCSKCKGRGFIFYKLQK